MDLARPQITRQKQNGVFLPENAACAI